MNVMKLAITISWLVITSYAVLVIYLETHRNSRMYQYFPRVRGKVTKYCLSAVTDLYLAGFLIYYDLLWIIASNHGLDRCKPLPIWSVSDCTDPVVQSIDKPSPWKSRGTFLRLYFQYFKPPLHITNKTFLRRLSEQNGKL